MYEVGVVEQFEAAHRLRGDFGPATRTHGHTYRVELVLRGPRLRDDGTLCDLGQVGNALRQAVGELHYQDLDALPALKGRNTTAEVVAEYLLDRVAPGLALQGLDSLAVRLWESPTAFAGVERPITPRSQTS